MKFAAAAASLALLGHAFAGPWQEELSAPQPGRFPLPRAMHTSYKFGWGSFAAARAEIDFEKAKAGQLKLSLTAQSTGAVRALWHMDARYTATCEAATLRPLRSSQTEVYRKETEKTSLAFDPAGVARRRETSPSDGKPVKTKRFDFPNVFDLHTALLFVRSQRLEPGDVYQFVVYPATAPYLARIEVTGLDRVECGGRRRPAIKLELKLQRIDKTLALEPHEKFKSAAAWLSDDKDRLLLKVEAEVFVGHVWLELETVKFTEP